jgi:5'-phosphate synthase pdxT subunit
VSAVADGVRAGVLALQGDVAEHVRALEEAGARAVVPVRRPEDLDAVDALVIPGGESTTIGRLMREVGLEDAVRVRAQAGMPVFGTCAGMILLATEIADSAQPRLGILPCRVRRNAYGRQVDSFETRLHVPELGAEPLQAVFIRAPYVESLGAGVESLAEHDGRVVLCRYGRVLAASFHPELTADRRLHRYCLGLANP